MSRSIRLGGGWGRLRLAGIVAGCLVFGALLAGCDTTSDSQYFRFGVGTNLYSDDIVQTTQLQDLYFTELCRQSLPLVTSADADCTNARMSPSDWTLIVQAGMNDVDRRCDSYLAWLDDRRRTNSAVLKELGDVTVASQAIMRVAGVSANPITLAGLAFGLASNTFTNINSRLLLEIDKTTVQTLVLHRRDDFRVDIRSKIISDRPTAVHALRLYLTICTPFAIETDINSTVTVFQTTGPGGLGNMDPLVNPRTVGMPLTSGTGTGQAPPRPSGLTEIKEFKAIIVNYNPNVHTEMFVDGLVRKLCLNVSDAKTVTRTTAAIQVFQMVLRDARQVKNEKVTGKLTDQDLLTLNEESKCDTSQFKNFYEESPGIAGGIKNPDVIPLLDRALATGKLPANASETMVRAAIPDARRALGTKLTLLSPELANQLTPDLITELGKLPSVTVPAQ